MSISLIDAVNQIRKLTNINDPLEAIDAMLSSCEDGISNGWNNWIFFRHLIVKGEVLHDPASKEYSIEDVELLLDFYDLLETLESLPDPDPVLKCLLSATSERNVFDIVWIGAVASILIDSDYFISLSEDEAAEMSARQCLGWVFGQLVKKDFVENYL